MSCMPSTGLASSIRFWPPEGPDGRNELELLVTIFRVAGLADHDPMRRLGEKGSGIAGLAAASA